MNLQQRWLRKWANERANAWYYEISKHIQIVISNKIERSDRDRDRAEMMKERLNKNKRILHTFKKANRKARIKPKLNRNRRGQEKNNTQRMGKKMLHWHNAACDGKKWWTWQKQHWKANCKSIPTLFMRESIYIDVCIIMYIIWDMWNNHTRYGFLHSQAVM